MPHIGYVCTHLFIYLFFFQKLIRKNKGLESEVAYHIHALLRQYENFNIIV